MLESVYTQQKEIKDITKKTQYFLENNWTKLTKEFNAYGFCVYYNSHNPDDISLEKYCDYKLIYSQLLKCITLIDFYSEKYKLGTLLEMLYYKKSERNMSYMILKDYRSNDSIPYTTLTRLKKEAIKILACTIWNEEFEHSELRDYIIATYNK